MPRTERLGAVESAGMTQQRVLRPKLAAIKDRALAIFSLPYASDLRAGRRGPHARHWYSGGPGVGAAKGEREYRRSVMIDLNRLGRTTDS
jgi:hypothetical protein